MKLSASILTLAFMCAGSAMAEVIPTSEGAKITLDSITTEVTVCSPTLVRVNKYIATPDAPASPSGTLKYTRKAADGKYKIDTGEYYVAINEKDGNVSFWHHDGTLIMAEQHRQYSFTPVADTDTYTVSQDFQIGRSGAQSIITPGNETNLIGTLAELGSTLPSPCILTDKGYAIHWQSGQPGRMDDTPGRNVKKPGDVTFTSDHADSITYTFIYPAEASTLTSFDW